MNVSHKNKEECCGCTACESICPYKAILLKADELGFLYPNVDSTKCQNCELCVKVCSFTPNYERPKYKELPIPFALRHKNKEELHKSQSGAAFIALSDYVLNNGGVVYGVSIDYDFIVRHHSARSFEERETMRGSKYVQSDLRGIFHEIKENLKSHEKVLFVGTPCQIAGLLSFIPQKLKENLYTIDLLCHGVGSPKIWKDYIGYLKQKYRTRIFKANFRDKKFGWRKGTAKETYQTKETIYERDTFLRFYFSHNINRESCFVCPFTNLKRLGDISIGDFWGWEKVSCEFNDNLGVSLVLINTTKGEDWFEQVKDNCEYRLCTINDCMQNVLYHPAKRNPQKELFLTDYKERGFLYVGRKYADLAFYYPFKQILINIIVKTAKYIKK